MRNNLISTCNSALASGGRILMQKYPNPETFLEFFSSPIPPFSRPFSLVKDSRGYVVTEAQLDNLQTFLETSNLTPFRQIFASLPLFFLHKLISNTVISAMNYFVHSENENTSKFWHYSKKTIKHTEPFIHFLISSLILSVIDKVTSKSMLNDPNTSVYFGLHGYDAVRNDLLIHIYIHGITRLLHYASSCLFRKQAEITVTQLQNLNLLETRAKTRRQKSVARAANKSAKNLNEHVKVYSAWSNLDLSMTQLKSGNLIRKCISYESFFNILLFKFMIVQFIGGSLSYHDLQSNLTNKHSGIMLNCDQSDNNYDIFLSNVYYNYSGFLLANFVCFGIANMLHVFMGTIADIITGAFQKPNQETNEANVNSSYLSLRRILGSVISFTRFQKSEEIPQEKPKRDSYKLSDEQASLVVNEPSNLAKRRKGKEKASSSSDEENLSADVTSSSCQAPTSTGIKFQISHLDYREFFQLESLSAGNMMAFGIVLNKDTRVAEQYIGALSNCTSKTVIRIGENGYSSKLYRTKNSDDRLLGYSGKSALSQLEKFAFKGVSLDASMKELGEFAEKYGKTKIEIHTFNDVYTHSK